MCGTLQRFFASADRPKSHLRRKLPVPEKTGPDPAAGRAWIIETVCILLPTAGRTHMREVKKRGNPVTWAI